MPTGLQTQEVIDMMEAGGTSLTQPEKAEVLTEQWKGSIGQRYAQKHAAAREALVGESQGRVDEGTGSVRDYLQTGYKFTDTAPSVPGQSRERMDVAAALNEATQKRTAATERLGSAERIAETQAGAVVGAAEAKALAAQKPAPELKMLRDDAGGVVGYNYGEKTHFKDEDDTGKKLIASMVREGIYGAEDIASVAEALGMGAQGTPVQARSFNSVAEAAAAGLPPGTEVLVDGRRARIK